jgi:hypothetical protein
MTYLDKAGRLAAAAMILSTFAAPLAGFAAQPSASERAKVLQTLVDCRKLTADAERLACYDRATTVLDEAEKKGEVVVVDQAQVREVRRQAFGFSLPSLTLFNRATKDDAIQKLEATIDVAREDAMGRFRITTTEGATWVQTDGDLNMPPKQGQSLIISPGMMGSFFCKVNHQAAVRCKREN